MVARIEEMKNREDELQELIEQSKGSTSKKDKIYAKMLKMKDRKLHKLTSLIEKMKNDINVNKQLVSSFNLGTTQWCIIT